MNHDLIIIGNGPAARAAAITAAGFRARVALVAPERTAPSEARPEHLRAIVARLLADRREARPTMAEVARGLAALDREESLRLERLAAVETYRGNARFLDEATVLVEVGGRPWTLQADMILIATGTRPARPRYVPFAPPRIITAEEFPAWVSLPGRVAIVGGGTTGREHARLLAALGAEVEVIDARPAIDTDDIEREDDLPHPACLPNVNWRSGVETLGAVRLPGGGVSLALDDGGRIVADAALWCTERLGNTEGLDLAAAGVAPDERGRLWCNDDWRTWAPGIFAAGAVAGYPRTEEDEAAVARRIVERAFAAGIRRESANRRTARPVRVGS